MKERIVIDGSIALAWVFQDEHSEYANEIAKQYRNSEFIVPFLFRWEFANVLTVAFRRNRCRRDDVTAHLEYLSGMPFHYDEISSKAAWSDTLELAIVHNLTVYDAAYLELALRELIPLATLDADMKKAAKAAGVKLFRLDAGK